MQDEPEEDPTLQGRTFLADRIMLYTDEQQKEICAMIGKDPVEGIAGFGASVPEALHDLPSSQRGTHTPILLRLASDTQTNHRACSACV